MSATVTAHPTARKLALKIAGEMLLETPTTPVTITLDPTIEPHSIYSART